MQLYQSMLLFSNKRSYFASFLCMKETLFELAFDISIEKKDVKKKHKIYDRRDWLVKEMIETKVLI